MKKLYLLILTFLVSSVTPSIVVSQEGSDSFKDFVEKYFGNNYSAYDPSKLDTSIFQNLEEIDKSEIIGFHKLLKYMIQDELDQKKMTGSVGFGLNTDNAGDNSQYRLSTGFELNRGTYPERLEVSSDVEVTLNNGLLLEEVSNLVVSYDRRISDWVESYGFVRRHSDNYMSVDERYELGVGLVFEKYTGKLSDKGESILRDLDLPLSDTIPLEIIEKSLSNAADFNSLDLEEIADRIEDQREYAEGSFDSQYSGLRLAFLAGFNGEIEQNTLSETFNVPTSIDSVIRQGEFIRMDTSFRSQRLTRSLQSDFIWRLVLRPTISWRKGAMTISWNAYFKLPLLFWQENERSIEEDEALDETLPPIRDVQRGTDWRLENRLALTIKKGPVTTRLSYQYYYDNFPAMAYLAPREPSPIIRNVHLFQAEKHHHIVRLNLAYNFR